MKTAKKLASLLLVVVMVLAMATTAFAAEDKGTIIVDNPVANQTYTAYKIFDVTYSGSNYSYTIKTTSEWYSTVKAYAETEGNGLTLTGVAGDDTTFVVSTSTGFSAAAFANALKAAMSGKTGTTLTADGTTVKATNLDLGYYFVASTNGALCNLTTTDPTVTIHDKTDIPFNKVDDKESVDVGEIVTYTITGKVPDYTGFTTYTYLITDTMSEGLTFQKNVKVTVGGTDVTSNCTITYDKDNNANKFTVSIPVLNNKYTIGAESKVTYTAVVNENAVAKIEINAATLTYSNDPIDTSKTTTTPEDKETVYSAKVVINKYVKGSNTEKLAGAEFVLYKEVKTDGSDTTTKYYYKWNETDKKVEWTTDKAQATVKTTNDEGAASFYGLKDGTYYLEEIKAPAGYNLLKDPVQVTVNGANATTANLSSLTVTGNVENSSGAELPETGGMGTTIFYVLGSVLILAAVVLLVTRKRMSSR